MARNKIGLDMSELADFAARFEGYEHELKRGVESALKATKKEITENLQKDMSKHKRTGETQKSIDKDYNVKWEGTTAVIKTGFHFPDGLPSVFLMYGTPRIAKDTRLYNDIYGAKMRKRAAQLQKEAMDKVLKRIGG